MKQIWLLACANLRKSKGQSVSLLIMIILSSAFMNLGLITWRNYDTSFDSRAQELNTSDMISVIQSKDPQYIEQYELELREDELTKEIETRDILLLYGSCAYNDSLSSRLMAILNADDQTIMNRYEYVDKVENSDGYGIYLPYLFQVGGGYSLGDDFTLSVNMGKEEKTFTYQIAGFFDEIMLGTINSSTTGFVLESEAYAELSNSFSGFVDGKMYLAQIYDENQREVYATNHTPQPVMENTLYDCNIYDTLKTSRTVTSSIGSMLIVAFSIILSGIALVIIHYQIVNTIEEDMQNIGALKAIGYTGKQISGAFIIQFLIIAGVGAGVGIALSYLGLPFVVELFARQTGVIWNQGFDAVTMVITTSAILIAVLLVVLYSSNRVRKLTPITALRIGISTHNFKKNYVPLHSSKGSIVSLIAKKIFVQELKRNILVGFIIAFITFATAFAGILYYNISLHFDNFLVSTVGEIYDLRIETETFQKAQKLESTFKDMDEVRKVLYMYTDTIKSSEGAAVYLYTTHDFQDYDYQDMIYEGRFPKYDNEVAIGGVLANSIDKKIGDQITLVNDEISYTYLITGLIQGSNYMGHDAAMIKEGYLHLNSDYVETTLSLYLRNTSDGDRMLEMIKRDYGDDIALITNVHKATVASMTTYRSIVSMLVVIIAVITLAMLILTLFLVIKTSLLRKKKDFGIQKAIGFTTKQLILQNALGFLPIIMCFSLLGGCIAYVITNPILSVLFSSIGMMKVNFTIPWFLILSLVAGITLLGFLISILISMRIRKVTPYTLMSE